MVWPLNIGTKLTSQGTYVLEAKLGHGHFGTVYRAACQDESGATTSHYALKVMQHPYFFQRELENLQKVTRICPPSAKLVRLVDFFTHYGGESCYCLAMTPLARTDMERLIEDAATRRSFYDLFDV